MNAILPRTEVTGSLSLTEVFDYFDGPKLFVCENATGHYFLGYWIGADKIGESYWLIPISKDRYSGLRSGLIRLRDAITQPELGYLLRCRVHFLDDSTDADRLLPSDLDPALLPEGDQTIDLYTETLPARMSASEMSRKAVAIQRDLMGLHFDFPGTREDGPTKSVGRLLVAIQDLLDAIGQKIAGAATMRGLISNEILSKTETRLVQAAGGSFGLEITAVQQVNLFNDSLISDSIREFLELIEIGNEVERLRERLLEMKPRAASKYGIFLGMLISSQSPFRADWASPEPLRNRSVSLDLLTAAGALKTVEQITREVGENRTVTGHFIGIELPAKSFLLVIDGGDETYRGKFLESAMAAAEHATLNYPYRVRIRETLEITASGEERLRLEVENIEELDSVS